MRSRIWIAWLIVSLAQSQESTRPVYHLVDRPRTQQGLDTLLARGRVKPEELLAEKGGGRYPAFISERTIFRDEYTGAEVWRLTNFPSGVVRHAYSGVPAWNANGRFIQLQLESRATILFDQEKSIVTFNRVFLPDDVKDAGGAISIKDLERVLRVGEWSTTEPNILFANGKWKGKPAVVAYDLREDRAIRGVGPVRTFAAIAPVSADGKWVCWREGTQDTATSFGLAAADGSSFRSIATNGGIVAEQSPVTFAAVPDPPPFAAVKAGIHQMYFTRRADQSVVTNTHGGDPHGRLFTADGKMVAGFENLTHQCWHPDGKFGVFLKAKGAWGIDPWNGKVWNFLSVPGIIEGHASWNSYDPNWSAMSWRTARTGEIVRVSMREDHSVAGLCETCPRNPDCVAYDGDDFASLSPDGTKVLFMSTMSGSVNEYLVVAANPRPPVLAGRWTGAGYQLEITPDPLSRENMGYRVYRTSRSGQDYRQIAFVPAPDAATVPAQGPITFTVSDAHRGDKVFFAVRAQEWSGLSSRYSNDVSTGAEAVAQYIEPEGLEFTGFQQGFDPLHASDLYYLGVPVEGKICKMTLPARDRRSRVWIRVGGKNSGFSVNGKEWPKKSYEGWEWVFLGELAGPVSIESQSKGFKLDRVFVTPDARQQPVGMGLDYEGGAGFGSQRVGGVQAKPLTPFAAEISWMQVADARYYNIYSAETPDFRPAQANLLYSPPAGDQRAVDWGLKPGSTHYYKVVAVDSDGRSSLPSPGVAVKTGALVVHKVEAEYASATGAAVEMDPAALGGKAVLLSKGQSIDLKLNIPAEGDYVIWHSFRADHGQLVNLSLKVDGRPHTLIEHYDLTVLDGKPVRTEYEWSRYLFRWSKEFNGVVHFTAGEHTLELSGGAQPIHLERLVVTNDKSFVPPGRLCTF